MTTNKRRASMLRSKLLATVASLGGFPRTIELAKPPWKKSWNFGIDDRFVVFCNALRAAADYMIADIDVDVHIRAHRELHVSWY